MKSLQELESIFGWAFVMLYGTNDCNEIATLMETGVPMAEAAKKVISGNAEKRKKAYLNLDKKRLKK